jgi:hypothetical protein
MREGRWFSSILARTQATHAVYLAILVLALNIALEDKRVSDSAIVVTLLGAVVALMLAELYAYCVGTMIGEGRRPTGDEFRSAALGSAGGLVATIPPVALLMLGVGGVIGLHAAFTAAKWVGASVIVVSVLYATRNAGLSATRSLAVAALFAVTGVGLVLMKHYFH